MLLNRITSRALEIMIQVGGQPQVSATIILNNIRKSEGMGTILLQNIPKLNINKQKSVDPKILLKEAYHQSIKFQHTYVGTEHLLVALLKLSGSRDLEVVKGELRKINVFPGPASLENIKKTPLLDTYGVNMNYLIFGDGNFSSLDRNEYKFLVSTLLQKNNPNPLLIGASGVGKRSLVKLLVKNINSLNVPPLLFGHQVIEFDLLSFMTGFLNKTASDFGISALVDELKSAGKIILYIKNFQNLFFSTSAGFAVPIFYSMFKSSLENTGIKIITSMNTDLYERIEAENQHLIENFTVVEVLEPDEKEILQILRINSDYLSKFHTINISEDLITYIYRRSKDEIKDIKFPQKGLELMDRACSRLLVKKTKISKKYKNLIDRTYKLAQNFDQNIEEGNFRKAAKERRELINMEGYLYQKEQKMTISKPLILTTVEVDEAIEDLGGKKDSVTSIQGVKVLSKYLPLIKQQIIGQDLAVDAVVKALVRARLGLRSKKRPIGNFLFLGPTGVGKTELAKVLAQVAFGEDSLIRLDMSDFSEKHNVARLVGAPPGYVGYGEGGELTSKIELKPDSVVLFDEIEKAHPDVLNILLQIMEEGELSDAKGNKFDFSSAVVILTSNLGTDIMHNTDIGYEEKELSDESVAGRLQHNLKKILKPELINRFDDVIVFKKLKQEGLLKILDLLLNEVLDKLISQSVHLRVNNSAKKYLLKIGHSDEYGARSLRRAVEKELLDKIAEALLANEKRPLTLTAAVKNKNLLIVSS